MTPSTGRPASLVAFDLEATGLSPRTDHVLEVGAVRYDAGLRRVAELELVVDPGVTIPLAIQRLVGLGPADVAGAPSPAEALAQLADFTDGSALIVHGGAFDLQLCRALLPDVFADRLVFDTLDLARILLPEEPSHSLPQLSARLGLRHDRPHRALSDAAASGDLFVHLAQQAALLPQGTLAEVRRVAEQAGGSLAAFFATVVEGEGAPAHTGPAADTAPPPQAASAAPQQAAPDRLDDAAAAVLAGAGETALGFEYREAQVQMGRAVAQALERRRRLLVEAGTGVGKSRAYLVPLALWASRTGGRAVVATHTVNLQEQIAERDIPSIARLLPVPPVAVLKGRNHYVSLRRWRRFLAADAGGTPREQLDEARFKLKVLAWLTRTRTGDRSELHLNAEEEPYWRLIASDTDDCLGTLCANWATRRCHMVAARAAAADAAIIVTNHALLLAASERQGQVLPDYSALVIDEAHQLEAAATRHLGASVRGADLAVVLDRASAAAGASATAVNELGRCREAAARLFGDVKGFLGERLGGENAGNGRVGVTPEVLGDPRFTTVQRAARAAVLACRAAAAAIETARDTRVELLPGGGDTDELSLAAASLRGIAATVERVMVQLAPGFVAWLEMRAEQSELHEAPVSVAEPLRELVFDTVDAAVLTSATLTVAGDFGFIRERVGIGDGADELSLPSPFDYLRQSLCVLAGGVPPYDDPRHDGVVAAMVARIAERLGGRMLVLFTGYGPLRRVHALLHDRMEAHGVALLGQGIDGTRRQILNSFLQDPRTVLLGTNSFWEGVDIPGERLRCVLIDKLPFAVPTDPLVRARTEGLRDPFAQYILPAAVIRLRQGFGRLIRGSSDRGAAVLCDDRLSTRDYGEVFMRALPPAAVMRAPYDDVPRMVEAFALHGQLPEGVTQSPRD